MPKLQTAVTTKSVHELDLEPELRRKLRTRLMVYADLKASYDALKVKLDREKAVLDGYREQTGEQSISIDGHTLTEVRGVTKTLDKKRLVALGCAMAWIDEATTEKPKRSYLLVTLAGEEEDDNA